MTSSKTSSAPLASARSRRQLEEARLRRDEAHVRRDRARRGSRRTRARPSPRRRASRVVPGHDDRRRRSPPPGTPGDAGMPCVARPEPASREQPVDVAVVGAGELQERLAAGRGAREPDRAHRRLGARGRHAQHLDGRHAPRDLLGELDLALGRRAEARPERRRRRRPPRQDPRVRVAVDQRAPRADVVDVAVAVDVDELGAGRRSRRRAGRARSSASRARASSRRPAGPATARCVERGRSRRRAARSGARACSRFPAP